MSLHDTSTNSSQSWKSAQPTMDATMSAMPSSSTDDSKPMAIQSLISPPIKSHDSFQQNTLPLDLSVAVAAKSSRNQPAVHPPPSPPVSQKSSPENQSKDSQDINDGRPGSSGSLVDPVLYPGATIDDPQPLFPPTQDGGVQNRESQDEEMIDAHIANRPQQMFKEKAPPSKEEYKLCVSFVSGMMGAYMKDPKGWLRMCRDELKSQNRARAEAERQAKQTVHRPIRPAPQPQPMRRVPSSSSASRVSKPKRPPTSPRSPPIQRVVPSKPDPSKSAVAAISSHRFASVLSRPTVTGVNPIAPRPIVQDPLHPAYSAQPLKRTVKATAKKVESDSLDAKKQPTTRADKDFDSIPDYSPPLSSLDGQKPGCMKVEWRGQHMDLSRDPLVGLLHKEEVLLAGCIRVDCATYLTAKRRIFQRRLECMMQPKEFRKTDAQQACHIDVNKASKMWQAFDKVGWLDSKWMAPHVGAMRAA
ncbi:uncharacterized protein PpBr36_09961 [Pyricularia pennisetigena]|uniref:uncharacterized protein n=1 Tax=Pyricularia pennisetigena TaxID=1578925 RepID=UPI0011516217|nr:uncharacterized protein PpBr36_09961 [Pyricularia pennisetigena]TLS22506.1 hypothetical protein PpBr36_09961 [Pyricularia pennisetigena]